MDPILLGLASAAGFFLLALKLDLRKVARFDVVADSLVSGALLWMAMQSGTLGAFAGATFGGLAFGAAIYLSKLVFGTKSPKIELKGKVPHITWMRDMK